MIPQLIKIYFAPILLLVFTLLVFEDAKAQGPTAPEAAGFEPVDATDMVSLASGDFTYVLPLLNVPSPEGGYPIALSYHAGIAMDQEASWVGLGWNLNPGAINRGVNGYPDDYNSAIIKERLYDETQSETTTNLDFSYESPDGSSIGLSLSHNSNKGFGGIVKLSSPYGFDATEIGVQPGGKFHYQRTVAGLTYGTNGVGLSLSGKYGPVSVNASLNSKTGLSAGYSQNLGIAQTNFTHNFTENQSSGSVSFGVGVSKNLSLGISLTSDGGVGVSASSRGVGGSIFNGNNYTASNNDYNVSTKSKGFSLAIPTKIGIFSIGFRKTTIKWALNKWEVDFANGPLYFENARGEGEYIIQSICDCYRGGGDGSGQYDKPCPCNPGDTHLGTNNITKDANDYMDMYELSWKNELDHSENNMSFPAYDSYNVSAQGLSGSMTPMRPETGRLLGLTKEVAQADEENYKINYNTNASQHYQRSLIGYSKDPFFSFNGEYVQDYIVSPASIGGTNNKTSIYDYLINNTKVINDRKVAGTYVEFFTNSQIVSGVAQSAGLLMHKNEYESPTQAGSGIGAYKITTKDGKVYHYAQAVYNHETLNRSWGFDNGKDETRGYQEVQQLVPYATHWLLTAITGPDYVKIDSNRNYPEEGDYGYWIRFDYGQWSNAWAWKFPMDQESIAIPSVAQARNRVFGRKQLYYLDKIKTRTHTALFVKDGRNDASTPEWQRREVNFDRFPNRSQMNQPRFTIPSQNPLRLSRIILVKNEHDIVDKGRGSGLGRQSSVNIEYYHGKTERASYNKRHDLIDESDIEVDLLTNALQVIELETDYTLARNAPGSNSGRLTLKKVHMLGKQGREHMPPYSFDYYNGYRYDRVKADAWGFHTSGSHNWSLRQIATPIGTKFNVNYENDKFKTLIAPSSEGGLILGTMYEADRLNSNSIIFPNDFNTGVIEIGKEYYVKRTEFWKDGGTEDNDPNIERCSRKTAYVVRITSISGNTVNFSIVRNLSSSTCRGGTDYIIESYGPTGMNELLTSTPRDENGFYSGGGLRVSSVELTDGINTITNEYDYNDPETNLSSGIMSYLPLADNSSKEVPYGAELPHPLTMYEYVTTRTYSNGDTDNNDGYTRYRFNVLKNVTESYNKIDIDNFFSISETPKGGGRNFTANKEVSLREFTVYNNMGSVGQLLQTTNYNSEDQVISVVRNDYSVVEPTNGTTQESYQSFKEIDFERGSIRDKWLVNISNRINVVSTLASTSNFDGNTLSRTDNVKFDPITGEVLETVYTDGRLRKIKNIKLPAYKVYPEMGSKAVNVAYSNMLTQEALSFTQVSDIDEENWRTASSNINTWNRYEQTYRNSPSETFAKKIWRKHKNFIWKGDLEEDGTYKDYNDQTHGFNWALNATQSADWQEVSEITQYDDFSMPIEIRDINNNYSATKMGYNETKVIAQANGQYNEIHYSGAEDLYDDRFYGGGIRKGQGVETDIAHTGSKGLQLSQSSKGYLLFVKYKDHDENTSPKRFKASIWTYKSSGYSPLNTKLDVAGNIIDHEPNEVIESGDWIQLNFYAKIPDNSAVSILSSGGNIIVDDFRIHPDYASMNSYVYNEWDELTHILGPNNMATEFIYNPQGQLCSTYKEVANEPGFSGGFKLISKNGLVYKNGEKEFVCERDYVLLGGTLTPRSSFTVPSCTLYFDITASSSVASWKMEFGEGTPREGTGVPPSSIGRSYQTTGNKTIRLMLVGHNGQEQIIERQINVIPGYRYQLRNRTATTSNLWLYGKAGDLINFKVLANGSGNISGSAKVNNVTRNSSQNSYGSAGAFPSDGRVEVQIVMTASSNVSGGVTVQVQQPGCSTPASYTHSTHQQ